MFERWRMHLRLVPELQDDLDVRRNGFAVAAGWGVKVPLYVVDGGGAEFGRAGKNGDRLDVAAAIDQSIDVHISRDVISHDVRRSDRFHRFQEFGGNEITTVSGRGIGWRRLNRRRIGRRTRMASGQG